MEHTDFELAAGSVVGRDHRVAHRNCQDGLSVIGNRPCTIGIVTDGCGSGRHSEIGAQLGAQLLGKSLLDEVQYRASPYVDWDRIRQDVLSNLQVLARGMGGIFRQTVQEYFLFTVAGVLLAHRTATFFALGDGVLVVNGELCNLGHGNNNQPPYLGYGLLGGSVELASDELQFRVLDHRPLDELSHFMIGTDGVLDLANAEQRSLPGTNMLVGELSQFWIEDKFFTNPDGISRQLRLAARDWPKRNPAPGLLPDDTTLITGRRIPQPGHTEE